MALTTPLNIHLCDGSDEEYRKEISQMVIQDTLIPLSRPNSFLARSNPEDVARTEDSTFICSQNEIDAGPTNNWKKPKEMRDHLHSLFKGCMRGRTLYIIPFSMGPIGSPMSQIGVEITDSPYVVASMRIMTKIGKEVLEQLDENDFVPCLHSVGVPLVDGLGDVPWPCNPEKRIIAHFPETKEIFSFGSGYGGNALLGKKCFALRIASVMAKENGWLAEHMLILGLTNPQGKKKYIAAAFPSACGKTNLAMLTSTLPGWKVETVGDDIAWMKFDEKGQLYAINPESGFFGVAPGTSYESNPNAMMAIERNTLFTNVALTDEHDVWWEGMTPEPPEHLIDWLGNSWTPSSTEKAAHPNSRFTALASQCPVIDPLWQDPKGVPISAILFGGRRNCTVPLVTEAFNWQHGVLLGASVSSETTAASAGEVGKVRHDPFAMLPFCGYNMGDYFSHWLKIGLNKKMPSIYQVNWFLKDKDGKFIWPGFGENIRVLKWIFERDEGTAEGVSSPIGHHPDPKSFDLTNLDLSPESKKDLFQVNKEKWLNEVDECESYFKLFKEQFPQELHEELKNLRERLSTLS